MVKRNQTKKTEFSDKFKEAIKEAEEIQKHPEKI